MNIGLCGLGKAGREFVEYSIDMPNDCDLCSVLCRNESSTANKSVSEITNIKLDNDIAVTKIDDFSNEENLDVIVDFSSRETSLKLVDLCAKYKINLVICPTDFTEKEIEYISNRCLINKIGIIYAPTLTLGVNTIITFVKVFSSIFPDFSFEIVEKHGKFKPKPTKTAKIIAENIDRDSVPISSIRLDGYVGVHEIIATNGNEKICFSHESFSRRAFAEGAFMAANFVKNKVGFFDIKEMYAEMMRK